MYVPGVLWTAAHHRIPLLSVMHNNRAYHQEVMHLQRMAARRQRGVDGHALIGTMLDDPALDFAKHRERHGRLVRGADHGSRQARPGAARSARGRRARRAGAHRRRVAAALSEVTR